MIQRTRTAARRSGDDYQDLVAADALLQVLKYPSRYQWVKLEAREAGKLDDVLLYRSDGAVIATQVKFSTNPLRPGDPWTWDKFLAPSKSGSSLIQDWHESIRLLDREYRKTIPRLVSNRSATEELCLKSNGLVDAASTDPDVLKRIEEQLGNETSDFLERFRFEIDEQDFSELDERLLYEFQALGVTERGWLSLREAIRRWIRCENLPSSGLIRVEHIRRESLWRVLTPLPQNFEVPPDYTLPTSFHPTFIKRVIQNSGSVIVLTAGPGVGKSTYLSYMVQQLKDVDVTVVRHHYALQQTEPGSERLDADRVTKSLMADIRTDLHSLLGTLADRNPAPDDFSSWLNEVGDHLRKDNRKLVVVVDGLDHVWRAEESRFELNKLFRRLIPVPEGVSLVVGTQPVEDSNLPVSLLQAAPRQDWEELPRLDVQDVKVWLTHHLELIPTELRSRNEQWHLLQLANSLHARTDGHPLLLRYIIERIALNEASLTVNSVEAISETPSRSVEEYYRSLWLNLPIEAKDLLLLIAIAGFPWPEGALLKCLQLVGYERRSSLSAVSSIRHLLAQDAIGQRAFHSSLLLFAKQQEEFSGRQVELRNAIIEWLEIDAPEYWRRSHLWLLQLEAGSAEPIIVGTNRQWVVKALADGHPAEDVANVLQAAAWKAIEIRDFPTYTDRGLLADYVGAIEIYDDARYWMFTAQLLLNTDSFLVRRAIANINSLSDRLILGLGVHQAQNGANEEARICLNELNRRISRNVDPPEVSVDWQGRYASIAELAGAMALPGDRVVEFLSHFSEEIYQVTVAENWIAGLRRRRDVRSAIRVLEITATTEIRRCLSRYVAAQAACEGLNLSSSEQDSMDPLYLSLYRMFSGIQPATAMPTEPSSPANSLEYSYDEYPGVVGRYIRDLFFYLVVSEVQSPGSAGVWKPRADGDRWLNSLLSSLASGAIDFAETWRKEGKLLITAAYDATSSVKWPGWEGSIASRQQAEGIEIALRTITEDLLAFRGAISGVAELSWEEAGIIAAHGFSGFRDILQGCIRGTCTIARESILDLCSKIEEELDALVEPFADRSVIYAQLAVICARFGLLEKGRQYLYRASENLIGYGYHKDTSLDTALNVLGISAEHSSQRQQLLKLAPAIASLMDFTDGDGTTYLAADFGAMLLRFEPGMAINYVRDLMDTEEYSDAESILQELVRTGDLTDPIVKALVSTCIEPQSIRILEERGGGPNLTTSEILRLAPGFSATLAENEQTSSGENSPFPEKTDPLIERFGLDWQLNFPPDQLKELVKDEALTRPSNRSEKLASWLFHWSNSDRAAEALDVVEPYFLGDNQLEVTNSTVDIVRRINGRTSCYQWLVRAQQTRHGWRKYWTDAEEVRERWNVVKADFPGRRHHFLVKSLRPMRGFSPWFGGTIAHIVEYLVYFDQGEDARRMAGQMVETVCALVSGQALPIPQWTDWEG